MGQVAQVASLVAAVAVLYLPMAQLEHAEDSLPDVEFVRYFPSGQAVHEREEEPEKRPAPQVAQARDS